MKSKHLKHIFRFNQTCRDEWVEQQAVGIPSGSAILDVGAGSCRYRNYFDHCEYRTHDFALLSSDSVDKNGYGRLDYVSDILKIPVPDSSFDCILCTEVLEHVPEPIKAIHEITRILRPGGQLILTAPLRSGIHQDPFFYYGGYSPFWYERFLGDAGFVNINITPNGGFFRSFGEESQRFSSRLFHGSRNWRSWRFWLFPVLIFPKAIFSVFIPLLCHWLDKIDFDPQFTIGYHVAATLGSNKQ